MPSTSLLALGDARFIRLTTFRRSGEPVGTTVCVARDGESLVAFTSVASGKLKRLRHTNRVEVVESSRSGQVDAGAVPVEAVGHIDSSSTALHHVTELLKRKYGLQYRVIVLMEKAFSRGSRDRDVIRITAD